MKFIAENTIDFDDFEKSQFLFADRRSDSEILMGIKTADRPLEITNILRYVIHHNKLEIKNLEEILWEKIQTIRPRNVDEEWEYLDLLTYIPKVFKSSKIIDYNWIYEKIFDFLDNDAIREDYGEFIETLFQIGRDWPSTVKVDYSRAVEYILKYDMYFGSGYATEILESWPEERRFWNRFADEYILAIIEYVRQNKEAGLEDYCEFVEDIFNFVVKETGDFNYVKYDFCSFGEDVECRNVVDKYCGGYK